MPKVDPVVLELKAEIGRYQSDLAQAQRTTDTRLAAMESRFRRSSTEISGSLRGLAGTLATIFTGRELITLLDSFTRFQNSLKVAGVEGANLQSVTDRLFASAQKYGVALESVGQLYGRISNASKELGASQGQVLKATDAISAAIKVSGGSAESAAGALLQLGQALGGGKIQAEEYNSLIDGLHPLLEAVAASSDKYGGSVAKLTAAVKSGQVTSAEFFQLILKGADILDKRAASATLTLSAGFTTLTNALTVYFGQADKANGVSAALGEALKKVADNLDTLIPALATVSVALGVGFVTNAIRARIALAALAAAELGVAGAAGTMGVAVGGALRAILAAVGGLPGIAILGLAAAFYYTTQQLKALDVAEKAAAVAHTREAAAAKVATDASEQLANAHGKEREAILSAMQASRARAAQALQTAQALRAEAAAALAVQVSRFETAKHVADQASRYSTRDTGAQAAVSAAGGVNAGQQSLDAADVQIARLQGTIAGIDKALADAAKPVKLAPVSAGKPKKTKAAKGSTGPSATEIAEQNQVEIERLSAEELRARYDLATTAEDRADLAKQILDDERNTRLAEIDRDDKFSAAQKEAQKAFIYRLYGAPAQFDKDGNATVQARPGLLYQRANLDAERELSRLTSEQLGAEKDALEAVANNVTTLAERRAIGLRILDLQQQIERATLEEAIASGKVKDAQQARALLATKQAADRTGFDIANAGPLAAYARSLDTRDTNTLVEGYVVDELQHVRDSIASAVQKATGIKDPLINNLISLLVENLLIRPITNALANAKGATGGGGGLGGLVSGIGAVVGTIFGRASGGYVAPGQMVRVNEASGGGRVEGFMSRDGGRIIPLGQMNALTAPRDTGPAIVQIHVAEGQLFEPRVQAISGNVSVQVVRAAAPGMIDASKNATIAQLRRPTI